MNHDKELMADFFRRVTTSDEAADQPGIAIYQWQIRYRRLAIPSEVFLHRLQNIWGSDLIWQVLDDFFQAHPARSHRWNRILAGLPAFIEGHEDFQRILGLMDLCTLALKIWDCVHSESRSVQHVPSDPIDLYALWNRSASRPTGDPLVFWKSITQTGPRGCAFVKISEELSILEPIHVPGDDAPETLR